MDNTTFNYKDIQHLPEKDQIQLMRQHILQLKRLCDIQARVIDKQLDHIRKLIKNEKEKE